MRLREVLPADLAAHFAQQDDAEANAMAAVPTRDRAAFDALWERLLADPAVYLRSVVAGEEVVGSVLSLPRDDGRHVGYRVGREHWGRGIATAALGLMLGEIAERPLLAVVALHNERSLRVVAKHGFTRVGERVEGGLAVCDLRLD